MTSIRLRNARQRGAAAIALAAVLVAVTAILIGSQTASQRVVVSDRIISQLSDGRWAENAIHAFAFVHGRLPCPAASPNGVEDCGNLRAKGWLPVQTLESLGSTSSVPRQAMVYMLYRGGDPATDPDLAVQQDIFQPLIAAAKVAYKVQDQPLATLSDLCLKLGTLSGAGRWSSESSKLNNVANAARAAVEESGAGVVNVAYALAVPRSGSPLSTDSINPDMGRLRLESPARTQTQSYTDLVHVVFPYSLFDRLGCSSPMASLDALATANDFTTDAIGLKFFAKRTADDNIQLGSMFVAQDLLIMAEAAIDMVNAGWFTSMNTVMLFFRMLGLPTTAALVAMHEVGIAEAATAQATAAVGMGKATLNMANDLWQVALNVAVMEMIKAHSVWNDEVPAGQVSPAEAILRAADTSVWEVLHVAP